jgi:ribosomal protein L12E/L44/L45/RPP1/RPP2
MFEAPFSESKDNSEPKKDKVRRELNHWGKVVAVAAAGMKVLTSTLEGGKLTDADIDEINRTSTVPEAQPVSTEKKRPEIYQQKGSFENHVKVEDEESHENSSSGNR